MANYKLTTATPTVGATSYLAFTASATNTVVSSIVASDSSASTLEALIKKSGGSVLEVAYKQVQVDQPEELLTAPLALEAGDELYVRTSRVGANFVISYVEETAVPNDTALGGLIDVDTTGVTDGQSLVYSSSNSQWEPQTITGGGGGGSSTLDGLTDTDISGLGGGDLLRWNGSDWANASATTSIITEGTNLYYTDARADARVTAGIAALDADDIDDASTTNNRFVTPTQQTSLGFLAPVTTAIDLDQMDADVTVNNTKVGYTDAAVDARIGAADLSDLNDVSTTAASPGEVLKWNGSAWAPATDGGGAVDSVNTQTGVVVLDADDIDDASTTHKFATQTQLDRVDLISVTTSIDLDTLPTTFAPISHTHSASEVSDFDTAADARVAAADLQDLNNVTSSPTSGEFLKWDGSSWVTAAASGGTGGVVDSVNGISQAAVVLDADDIDDASTAHKFVTAGDVTKLGHISVTQAVDLDTMESTIASNTTGATAAISAAIAASNDVNTHKASIENHSDVTFAYTALNRPNNAFIVWDDLASRWEDGTISIDKCDDVDTTTAAPSTGDVLEWDGSNWVPAAPSTGGGGTNVHDTDSTFTSAGDYDAGADLMDFTTTALTLVAGKPYALTSTGWAVASNATSSATSLIAVCTSDSTTGEHMLLRGLVRTSENLSGNIGDPVYLSTGSKWTMAAPSSAASVVILGRLIDATNNVIWFDPDKTSITLQ
jgi:hypothetical protein